MQKSTTGPLLARKMRVKRTLTTANSVIQGWHLFGLLLLFGTKNCEVKLVRTAHCMTPTSKSTAQSVEAEN